jgi:predicted metalloprotease with PDZ domain
MPLYYTVRVDARAHLYHVEARLEREAGGRVWVLPVWTPGSYVRRDYAGFVARVTAEVDGAAARVHKRDKTTWVLDRGGSTVCVRYSVYAHELTVRTSFLDDRHGYINGAALFVYPEDGTAIGGQIRFGLPEGWSVYSALPAAADADLAFQDIDELIDSPIELGTPQVRTAVVDGVPHDMVLCGAGSLDLDRMAEDLPSLVEAARSVFGRPLPYPRYVFLIHQTGKGGGGLEHRASTSLQFPRFGGSPQEARRRFLGLVAHEYFHLWNVKRIHPAALGPFDYQHEVYTETLWLMEGGTDYYAAILLGRSGLVAVTEVLETLATRLGRSESRPGNLVQSLAESSFDAWIKFYRPHPGTPNLTVSYYEKGSLVAWLLDLELRRLTEGTASLDSLLRTLWARYPDGFPEDAPAALVRELGGGARAALSGEGARDARTA